MTGAPSDPLARVRGYRERATHLVAGLMTGTSADAVDAALVRFHGHGLETRHEMVAYRETELEPALRVEVLAVAAAGSVELDRLLRLDQALGERYAAAVLELAAEAGLDPTELDAVGMHGQTLRHVARREGGGQAFTLQAGSAAVVAERTGVTVVSDFRSRDVAAGGEGAPLVPLVDWWLFHSGDESRVLLNLGGIANVTHLPRGAGVERMVAFDTGPGNMVLDSLVRLRTGGVERLDHGGRWAARGRVHEPLMAELLADPFFSQEPPRSTGRERFGGHYAETLQRVGRSMGLGDDDLLATAVELTAVSVADAVRSFLVPRGGVDAVYASGGGVLNATLMAALERRLAPIPVRSTEHLGLAAAGKEALAFAFLAHQTLGGTPGNVPAATGASRPVVLGHITPGS